MRRKTASLAFATVMTIATGAVTTPPAAAAVSAGCVYVKGYATFNPRLPKMGSPNKVKSTFRVDGAGLGRCSGGGVTRGTLVATLKAGIAGNCATLRKFADMRFAGTAKIVWNTTATSHFAMARMTPVPHSQMIRMKLTGKVTAGKFVGETLTSEFNFSGAVGSNCFTDGLAKVAIRQAHPLTIE